MIKVAPKKMHPADVASRKRIAQAVEFTAFLRLGPHDKIVDRFPTMAEACTRADEIRVAHPGRDVIVYAIMECGASIPVPKDMQAGAAAVPAQKAAAKRTKAPAKVASKAKAKPKAATVQPEAVLVDAPSAETEIAPPEAALAPAMPEATVQATEAAPAAPATKLRAHHRQAIEDAEKGIVPPAPDFSKPTHKNHRAKHAALVALVEGRDLAGLKAFEIKPQGSSKMALIRYRDLAIRALEVHA